MIKEFFTMIFQMTTCQKQYILFNYMTDQLQKVKIKSINIILNIITIHPKLSLNLIIEKKSKKKKNI